MTFSSALVGPMCRGLYNDVLRYHGGYGQLTVYVSLMSLNQLS